MEYCSRGKCEIDVIRRPDSKPKKTLSYRRQQAGVLAQRSNAAGHADNERDRSAADQYEGRIEGHAARHAGQIVEDVLLEPRPEAHHQNAQAEQLGAVFMFGIVGQYNNYIVNATPYNQVRKSDGSYPKQHVHAENHVLEATAHLAAVSTVRLAHHTLGTLVRHN